MVSACPPAPFLPSDAWPPPPCSGVLAARRRLHDRARLKLSRTGSRSTTSGDHPRGPRRAGDKLILFIHRPTPCTPRGQCQRGHFRRLLQTGIAGSGLLWASQLDAAEGQQRRMFGLQPCLPVLGLGSLTQLSSRASLEQQRKLQGALARVAPLRPRIAAVCSAGKKSRIRDSSV